MSASPSMTPNAVCLNAHFCDEPCLEAIHNHRYFAQKEKVVIDGKTYILVLGCPPENLQRLSCITQVFESHLIPEEKFSFSREQILVTENIAFKAVDIKTYDLEEALQANKALMDFRQKFKKDLVKYTEIMTCIMMVFIGASALADLSKRSRF